MLNSIQKKIIKAEKIGSKDGKALYKLINIAVYGKSMESIRNIFDAKFVISKKDYLKWTSKPSYMSHKIFENDLFVISESKVALTLNKLAYIRMCILKFSKVLMYEFHYDYIKR